MHFLYSIMNILLQLIQLKNQYYYHFFRNHEDFPNFEKHKFILIIQKKNKEI